MSVGCGLHSESVTGVLVSFIPKMQRSWNKRLKIEVTLSTINLRYTLVTSVRSILQLAALFGLEVLVPKSNMPLLGNTQGFH